MKRLQLVPLLLGLVAMPLHVDALPRLSGPQETEAPHEVTSDQHRNELFAKIRQTISVLLGVDEVEIDMDTDLVADLYADPMTAFEILAVICDTNDVALPENLDLTRVGDILEHVKTAPKKREEEPAVVFRGQAPDAETEEIQVQQVFYGTDRNRTPSNETGQFYGGGRSVGGKLHYGVCEVTIPVNVHRKGKLERPSWWRLELTEDPRKHVVLRRIKPLDRDGFLSLLDSTLEDSQNNPDKDVLVFIHGFNVTFAAAARRTAQMAYDLDFAGVPLFFSWPSDGRMTSYFSDREDVEWAVLHVEKFLLDLKESTGAGRIHLIAHSMGNQALIRTLYRLTLRRDGQGEPLFHNVIMAAPDFDAHRFGEQIAAQVVSLAERWTLYASEKDFALDISTSLAAKRLGLPLSLPGGIDTIDASGVDVAPWSVPETHSYFSSKQRVINDLKSVLEGLAPAARNLIRRTREGRNYWALEPLEDRP